MYEKDGPVRRKQISYRLKSLTILLNEFTKMGSETFNGFDLIDPKNWDLMSHNMTMKRLACPAWYKSRDIACSTRLE